MSNKLRNVLMCVVTAVWAINFVAPVFVKGYVPPNEVHLVFMAIVSGLLLTHRRDDGRVGKVKKKDADALFLSNYQEQVPDLGNRAHFGTED